MRVVVTNDDGIESRGLDLLAGVCARRGWEAIVIAPSRDMSGSGAAIGHLRVDERVHLRPAPRDVDGATCAYVVDGPPGLAALLSCRGAIGAPPDLVLSGVNAGENTGHVILHSGTVGAALTAASFGVSGLAVSMQVTRPMRWVAAGRATEEALDLIERAPGGTVLNVNVPAAGGDGPGLRWARLDRFGVVRVAVASREGTALQLEYRAPNIESEPDSDTALLGQGYATVTAIEGVGEIEPVAIDLAPSETPAPTATPRQLPDEVTGGPAADRRA
ncbi:MAG: 5'/3'-nucleotidase SurE [Thermoleophilia bacterium]